MKDIINKVLTGIGVFFVLVLVLALVSNLMSKPLDKKSATLKTDSDFVKDYKIGYMKSCNEDGELYDYCKCTLDYLFDNYTTKRIMEVSFDYLENGEKSDYQTPTEMIEAVSSCIYLAK